jgi:sec-independent protein translocase protein TatC
METFDQKFADYYVYLDNIRRRLYSTAIVFILAFLAGFFEAGNMLHTFVKAFGLQNTDIVTTSPFQFLDLATKIGLYTACVVCLPVILFHLYDFLKEGLQKREKRLFFTLLPIGFGLFVMGFAYSFCILYFYLNSVSAINLSFGLKNVWNISDFLAQTIIASTFLGMLFQFPIVITFLIRLGVVSAQYLREKRFYVIAAMFIFVGFLPPPDIFSTFLQAFPLVALYELTLWINSAYSREGNRQMKKILAAVFITIGAMSSFFVHHADAAINKYVPGDTIVIGEFVYDDDLVATTSLCSMFIYNPQGTELASSVPMTALANGWHYYSTTTAYMEGVWPATMSCGSVATGDVANLDKTFIVGYTGASTTDIVAGVWGSSASSSIATVVNANTAAYLNGAVTSINSNTATVVNSASTSLAASIPSLVWSYTSRTLSGFGSLVASIWTNPTRNLTDSSLTSGSLAAQSDVIQASTSLAAIVNANTSSAVTAGVSSVNANTAALVNSASTSLAASIPSLVWSYTSRTLSSFGSLVASIWSNPTRNLTDASLTSGSLAAQSDVIQASTSLASMITSLPQTIWGYLTRTLTSSSAAPQWNVSASNSDRVLAGANYLATVTTVYDGSLVDSMNPPTVTIYDPSRNVVVTAAPLTRISTGTYTYSYSVPGNAAAGTWESVFSTTVESGKTLPDANYWTVVTTPAQVIINSVSNVEIPDIAANITITNEGLSGNEYQYEWCVVSTANNACGGGDDIFDAVAAKYINPGQDFNTTLTATVPSAGNYYFKVIAYFGTESSVASRSFTAVTVGGTPETPPPAPVAQVVTTSTGGGGGGGISSVASKTTPTIGACFGGDVTCDNKVDVTDFSVLLYYWKTKPPFKNTYVDMNKDGKVDAIDFSILLYRWGRK